MSESNTTSHSKIKTRAVVGKKQIDKVKIKKSSSEVVSSSEMISSPQIKTAIADKPRTRIRLKRVGAGRETRLQLKNALAKHDDLGTQSLSGTASAALRAPNTIKRVHKLGAGAQEVIKTGALATVTVANTIVFKRAQTLVAGSDDLSPKFLERARRMKIIDAVPTGENSAKIAQGALSRLKTGHVLHSQAIRTKLNRTKISRSVVRGVNRVQRTVVKVKRIATATARVASTVVIGTATVVRGLRHGTITLSTIRQASLKGAKNLASSAYHKGLPKIAETIDKATTKGIVWTVKRGIPSAGKISLNASIAMTRRLASNDMGIQGVYQSLVVSKYGGRAAHKTIQTAQVVVRGTASGVKTAAKRTHATVKKARPLWAAARRIGFRASAAAASKWAARRAGAAIANAGYSITSLAINFVKKAALPLLLGVLGIVVLFQFITAPIQAIGAIFSRSSSVTNAVGEEVDEIDLLDFASHPEYGVPALRNAFLNGMVESINIALSEEDEVRLMTDLGDRVFAAEDGEISVTILLEYFMTADQWILMVFPLFNTFMLVDHDLSATQEVHEQILQYIFSSTMRMRHEYIREFCQQSFGWMDHDPYQTGERYYSLPHFCGHTWEVYHPGYCSGHDDGYSTYYCTEEYSWYEEFECEECSEDCCDDDCSYSLCSMTDAKNLKAEFIGLYGMVRLLILDPLEELQAISPRTEDIEYEIEKLETALDIFIANVQILEEELEIELMPPQLLHLAG